MALNQQFHGARTLHYFGKGAKGLRPQNLTLHVLVGHWFGLCCVHVHALYGHSSRPAEKGAFTTKALPYSGRLETARQVPGGGFNLPMDELHRVSGPMLVALLMQRLVDVDMSQHRGDHACAAIGGQQGQTCPAYTVRWWRLGL